MTYQEREAIFSKEAISLDDMVALMGVSKGCASVKMSEMKRVVGDRLGIQGKIHVQDYLDYFKIKGEALARYNKPVDDRDFPVPTIITSGGGKTVCYGYEKP